MEPNGVHRDPRETHGIPKGSPRRFIYTKLPINRPSGRYLYYVCFSFGYVFVMLYRRLGAESKREIVSFVRAYAHARTRAVLLWD